MAWLQVAFAVWSILRIRPLLRLPWAFVTDVLLRFFFKKKKTEYKVFVNSEIGGNFDPDEYTKDSIKMKIQGSNLWKVYTRDGGHILCSEHCLKSVEILVCADKFGHNIIKEEIDVSAFIKIHRLQSLKDCLKSLPFLSISIRRDPEAIEFIESWPLSNTILNSSLPVIPLIFQARSLVTVSNTTFWLVVIADIFSNPLGRVLDCLKEILYIAVQRAVTLMPPAFRVYVYFFLYSLNKSLVSCNFITNKRESKKLSRLIISDYSFLYGIDVSGVVDLKKSPIGDYQGGHYYGDGFKVSLSNLTIDSQGQYGIKISLFRLRFRGGYSLVKEGFKEGISQEQLNCIVNCLIQMQEDETPPIQRNFKNRIERLHCFDIERLLDMALNSGTSYYKVEVIESEYEVFERVEVTLDKFNFKLFRENPTFGKSSILFAHNQEFFGDCIPGFLFLLLKRNWSPRRYPGIGNSELKLYLSDLNKLRAHLGLKKSTGMNYKNDSKILSKYLEGKVEAVVKEKPLNSLKDRSEIVPLRELPSSKGEKKKSESRDQVQFHLQALLKEVTSIREERISIVNKYKEMIISIKEPSLFEEVKNAYLISISEKNNLMKRKFGDLPGSKRMDELRANYLNLKEKMKLITATLEDPKGKKEEGKNDEVGKELMDEKLERDLHRTAVIAGFRRPKDVQGSAKELIVKSQEILEMKWGLTKKVIVQDLLKLSLDDLNDSMCQSLKGKDNFRKSGKRNKWRKKYGIPKNPPNYNSEFKRGGYNGGLVRKAVDEFGSERGVDERGVSRMKKLKRPIYRFMRTNWVKRLNRLFRRNSFVGKDLLTKVLERLYNSNGKDEDSENHDIHKEIMEMTKEGKELFDKQVIKDYEKEANKLFTMARRAILG